MYTLPTEMNIELTTACPLRCPQCYCSLTGGKHIALDVAKNRLKQAKELGVKKVNLSGGETLCYPYLYELIEYAASLGIESSIAISGWGFSSEELSKLQAANLTNIFVSLNGPTEEINALTRDGYKYAMNALELLKNSSFENVYINWVMHRSNADYLPEMIELAKKFNVKSIVVLAVKPTSKNELNTLPTSLQSKKVAELVLQAKGFVKVESCYSPMLALVRDTKLLGNLNTGLYKGCGAARFTVNVSVDGSFSPCRHLEYNENFSSMREYWENSEVLSAIRESEKTEDRGLCDLCRYRDNCRPCLACSSKLLNAISRKYDICPVYSEK